MPAERSNERLIGYDRQHEQKAAPASAGTSSAPKAAAANTTSNAGQQPLVQTGALERRPLSAADLIASPFGEQSSALGPAAETSGGDEGRRLAPGGGEQAALSEQQARPAELAELLAGGGQSESMATASSLSQSFVAAPTAATASLEKREEASGGGGLVQRHGRASYTPPATSRLSAYAPSFQLQNSRSHGGAGDQLSAFPLQLGGGSGSSQQTTTTTTTTERPPPQTPFDPIIVCYLGSWSVYRPGPAKFTPENINPFLCTHIIYAFAGLSSKFELKPFDSYNDITQGGYRKFTALKEHNKQLKTLIAVGGWNEGSAR